MANNVLFVAGNDDPSDVDDDEDLPRCVVGDTCKIHGGPIIRSGVMHHCFSCKGCLHSPMCARMICWMNLISLSLGFYLICFICFLFCSSIDELKVHNKETKEVWKAHTALKCLKC